MVSSSANLFKNLKKKTSQPKSAHGDFESIMWTNIKTAQTLSIFLAKELSNQVIK